MNRRNYISLVGTALLLLIASKAAMPQDSPIQQDSLYSNALNEERQLQVILPKTYKPGSPDKYDVLYVLDGETITPFASRTYNFLQGEEFVPELIIVGIPNTNLWPCYIFAALIHGTLWHHGLLLCCFASSLELLQMNLCQVLLIQLPIEIC